MNYATMTGEQNLNAFVVLFNFILYPNSTNKINVLSLCIIDSYPRSHVSILEHLLPVFSGKVHVNRVTISAAYL